MLKALIAVAAGLAAAALASAASAAEARIAPAGACAALVGAAIGPGVTVTKAQAVPAGPFKANPNAPELMLPAHCAVGGTIDPHTGPDGKPYAIEFAVNLPDAWNGRFLYQGGGGLNGVVNPPLGVQATGAVPALARGFVVASSDSGHKGQGFDRAWMADQEAVINFAYASVARTAPVGEAIATRYYGQAPVHAYFAGCSTGGREGMIAAERYPGLFDGILAGSPAMRTGHSNLALAWAAVAFNQVAAKDPATGKPAPGTAFSAAEKALVVKGILDACDRDDGLADGMVFATKACRFEPERLQCAAAKTDACLSAGQVKALRVAFSGPVSASGRKVYPGYAFDTGVGVDVPPQLPGLLPSARPSPLGPFNLDMTIDVETREAAINGDGFQRMQDTYQTTNLSGFFGRGAKLLMYHGVSDPWFSALDTADWVERVGRDNPKGADGVRLFLVPGMGHCQSGPTLDRFDMLGALVGWVEKGQAPQRVIATGQAFPGRSRPLCPYPAYARYDGRGKPEEADSFACAAP